MQIDIGALRAILQIREEHNLDYLQQEKLLMSGQLEHILIARYYMRRDQVTLMLYQEGILEKKQK